MRKEMEDYIPFKELRETPENIIYNVQINLHQSKEVAFRRIAELETTNQKLLEQIASNKGEIEGRKWELGTINNLLEKIH